MSAHAVIAGTGVFLAAMVGGLWLLQQYQRGRRVQARTVAMAIVLLTFTATAVADDADFDEATRLTDLGLIVPPPMWRVEPGDHFWRIAAATISSKGVTPTPERVEPYWRALIRFNQQLSGTPIDPDLLQVGELVWLPEPASGLGVGDEAQTQIVEPGSGVVGIGAEDGGEGL
ncbi:MAG: hypothetical protein ACR2QE_01260 [Acidimicrobiales bacterium]